MRLDNVPTAFGITVAAILTCFLGFPSALWWGIASYALALTLLLAYVVRLPVYDHATPVPPTLGIFGITSAVGTLYLLLRLWLWAPSELWFLRDQSWLGAILTLSILYVAPVAVELLVFSLFRSSTPPKGWPNTPQ